MMEEKSCRALPEDSGKRLDKVLSLRFPELSRSFLQKLAEEGGVFVNSLPAKKSLKLSEGDEIRILVPEPELPEAVPEDIPLDILYEDEDLLVVNKPKGMVVHPSCGHFSGTVVNAVMFHCGEELSGINGVLRPGIVHRIDKDTSGSLIICKNDAAHHGIALQLKEHSIERSYRAIVHGIIKEEESTIDAPIGRDPKNRLKNGVLPGGKRAVTHIRLLETFPGHRESYSYVECRLETGRTHQIRVHMAHTGHPLLGDPLYCPEGLRKKEGRLGTLSMGQCLHAKTLGFLHPVKNIPILTDAPMPDYFQNILEILRTA